MRLDGRLLPVIIGNPKIISQLDGSFPAGQLKQPRNKIHCIPVSLTAKAVKTPVQFHAGVFVIVKRADRHAVSADRDTVQLRCLSGGHILFDRFKYIHPILLWTKNF